MSFFNNFNWPCIEREIFPVAYPIALDAVQTYIPMSSSPTFIIFKMPCSLMEYLPPLRISTCLNFHWIAGVGKPSAPQLSIASSPFRTDTWTGGFTEGNSIILYT